MTRRSGLTGISGSVSATRNSSIHWCLRHGRNTMRTSPPAALSGRPRGTAFRCSGGMTRRSVPRSACLARSRIAEMGAPGGLECGMAADSAFRSSLPRLPWSRPGPAACHARRAAGKLAALRSGASSDRPVQGSSRALAKGPRKVADCDRREHGGAATAARGRCGAPGPGLGGCCRNSREAAASPCRRRVLRGAASPAARPVPFCGTASCPAADLTALRGMPALPGPGCGERILTRAAWCHFIAGDGRRCLAWNIAVYVGAFCGSEEEGCQAPFQGCAEAGYRAKQDVHKTALCIDRARSIHKLIPVPRPCRKFPSGILRRRARRAWRGN